MRGPPATNRSGWKVGPTRAWARMRQGGESLDVQGAARRAAVSEAVRPVASPSSVRTAYDARERALELPAQGRVQP